MAMKIAQQRSRERVSRNPARKSSTFASSRVPVHRLQNAIGNSAFTRLFNVHIQPKLNVSSPSDKYEREADRVADQVMRMPDPEIGPTVQRVPQHIQRACSKCEKEERQGPHVPDKDETVVQAKLSDTPVVSGVSSDLNMRSEGQPLSASTRAYFEPRFGQDFSHVRVHTDSNAAESARAANAVTYTLGRDIVFGKGAYAPHTKVGQRLLAHELTHTIQQAHNPTLRRTIQRATIDQFKTDLEGMSADHATVVRELFAHPRFIPLVTFLRNCPAGTIEFEVRRILLNVRGRQVDQFGGFTPGSGGGASTLEVNPHRQEHVSNPLEVVDTVVHEFIHAALGLRGRCETAVNPYPLTADVLDAPADPELAPLFTEAAARGQLNDALDRSVVASISAAGITTASGTNLLVYFDRNYGPGATSPETQYVDMNRRGLEFVTSIMSDIRSAHPGIGRETVSFDNVELFQAEALLGVRSWWNSTQRAFSMRLHKDRVARKRKIDPSTYTEREYDISAIHVVEFADRKTFDPNTGSGWGPVGGVWECHKRSRFTGRELHTYVTGTRGAPPGGATDYRIIQHT